MGGLFCKDKVALVIVKVNVKISRILISSSTRNILLKLSVTKCGGAADNKAQ